MFVDINILPQYRLVPPALYQKDHPYHLRLQIHQIIGAIPRASDLKAGKNPVLFVQHREASVKDELTSRETLFKCPMTSRAREVPLFSWEEEEEEEGEEEGGEMVITRKQNKIYSIGKGWIRVSIQFGRDSELGQGIGRALHSRP